MNDNSSVGSRQTGGSFRQVFLECLALFFWGVTLFVLIPPVPSIEGQTYPFLPRGITALCCFLINRALALRWQKHRIISTIIEAGLLLLFGWVITDRMQIH